MKVEDLTGKVVNGVIVTDEYEEQDPEDYEELLLKSRKFIQSVVYLFGYLSDQNLVRTITERERKIMDKLYDAGCELVEEVNQVVEEA